jgi:hypothetical protein
MGPQRDTVQPPESMLKLELLISVLILFYRRDTVGKLFQDGSNDIDNIRISRSGFIKKFI